MENISNHITYIEAIKTKTGLENNPGDGQLANMKAVAQYVFEPLRQALGGRPIKINSFFRSDAVNKRVGGSHTSQHQKGEAMDLDGFTCGNADIFFYIKQHLQYDQLIWEFGDDENPAWVHVSFSKAKNRKQIFKAIKKNGKTTYETL
jgi:zinc D-Ala-D-Ala carboxypeptidase